MQRSMQTIYPKLGSADYLYIGLDLAGMGHEHEAGALSEEEGCGTGTMLISQPT